MHCVELVKKELRLTAILLATNEPDLVGWASLL
jgi:hypothetical protein